MTSARVPVVEGLVCPCCGQPMRRQWQQRFLPQQPVITCTDCVNPACAGYYVTLEASAFMARFADLFPFSRHIGLVQHLYPWLTREQAFLLYAGDPIVTHHIDDAVNMLDQVRVKALPPD
jgi:hypothetical protein